MRRPLRRGSRGDIRALTTQQLDELTNGFAVLVDGWSSAFESEDQARAAWVLHGDKIMARWRTPFRRPRGWWLYERGEGRGCGLVGLISAGALTDAEIRKLPEYVSGWYAREILRLADLSRLPTETHRALAAQRGLLSGLAPRGVADFLEELSGDMYAAVIELQAIDLDALPKARSA